MRYLSLLTLAIGLLLLFATNVLADDKTPTAQDDKPAEKQSTADKDDAQAEQVKPATKAAPAAAPAPPAGGLRGRLRAGAAPGAPRPAADAVRAGIGAAVRAATELQNADADAPIDGEPGDRRAPPSVRPYAPPGGFGPPSDEPLPPEGPPPPRRPGDGPAPLHRPGAPYAPPAAAQPPHGPYAPPPHQFHDPEMEKLNTEEARLEARARDLSARYRTTTNDEARDSLRGDLEDVVLQQFEVRQQRRQLELEHLERQLKRLREAIEKRTSSREALIKQRIEQLVGEEAGVGF